jgi:general stress protein YciG
MAGETKKERRGFAALPPEARRELGRRGGLAAHRRGTAHVFTPEEARRAGQKGGRAVSEDRWHMAAIGRRGGLVSRGQKPEDEEAERQARAEPHDEGVRSERERWRDEERVDQAPGDERDEPLDAPLDAPGGELPAEPDDGPAPDAEPGWV